MLFTTLSKLKDKKGLTEDLRTKIDIFYVFGRLSKEEYCELMDISDVDGVE